MQHLATKCSVYDLALRVDEDVVRNALNLVDGGGGAFPALQVGNLQPRHFQLLDGLDPCLLLLVEGDADDFEALGVVLLVGFQHVGHLGATGTAPRGPEVYEHPLALAHEVADAVHLAVGIGHLEVGVLLADEGGLRTASSLAFFR